MFENRFANESKRFDNEPVVIGLFAYASDARRALHSLHQQQFPPDQIIAAFRAPADTRPRADGDASPMRSSGQWFGQLRQIYRGDDGGVKRGGTTQVMPGTNATGFEAMLAQIDLSPQDADILDQDLDRGAAIVTVRAGGRNQEARALLEERGARIVHGRHDSELPAALQPDAANIVHSAPFNPPAPGPADHIQLFGEVLRVRKEKVSSGDVHVRKESVTHMETVQVPVTREHLVVEHTDAGGRIDAENSVRVPLSEERVHVDKDTVLREEYKVGKREVTQNESVADTVRRERLLIDDATTKTGEKF